VTDFGLIYAAYLPSLVPHPNLILCVTAHIRLYEDVRESIQIRQYENVQIYLVGMKFKFTSPVLVHGPDGDYFAPLDVLNVVATSNI
jgi:hypothetical protein